MEEVRAFIALHTPASLQQNISRIQSQLRGLPDDIGWVRPESMHFTLRFLGNITPAQVEDIKPALREAVTGIAPFELHFGQVGVFPGARRPRVIWLGLNQPPSELSAIYHRLTQGLDRLGFPPEEREFSPHLTLGRIKLLRNAERLMQAIAKLDMPRLEPLPVDRVILFRSQLKPTGAVYTELYSCGLIK